MAVVTGGGGQERGLRQCGRAGGEKGCKPDRPCDLCAVWFAGQSMRPESMEREIGSTWKVDWTGKTHSWGPLKSRAAG